MYIVYNLLFTITINIEMSYYLNNTARWQYRILGDTNIHKCNIFPLENLWYSIVYIYIYYNIIIHYNI